MGYDNISVLKLLLLLQFKFPEMVDKPSFATKFAIAQTVAAVSVSVAYPFDTGKNLLTWDFVIINCQNFCSF